MSKRLKIYVAGPMSGHKYFNFPVFDEIANSLRKLGHEVFNPADIDRSLGFDPSTLSVDTDWKKVHAFDYIKGARENNVLISKDVEAVLKCDILLLLMLPGWCVSKGSIAELALAVWSGKKIYRAHFSSRKCGCCEECSGYEQCDSRRIELDRMFLSMAQETSGDQKMYMEAVFGNAV